MASVTVEYLLQQAKCLPAGERERLAKLLIEEPSEPPRASAVNEPTFLDTDPWFVELREAQRRAEDETGLHSLEEIMSRMRKRPWVTDDNDHH